MDLIADTTLLVGLWRRQPWATGFAASRLGASLGLPWVVLGEFWHGALRAGHDPAVVQGFLDVGIPLLDATDVVPAYVRVCRGLQSDPVWREVGQNDLWIAATCLAYQRPLVSRNRRHFDRIEGLRLHVLES